MGRLYILGGVVIAFLALGGYAFWQRGDAIAAKAEREQAVAQLAVAVEANAVQKQTISRLTEQNARTDRILADISAKLAGISNATAETQASVTELERTNESVRAYLAGVVPADLQRVLNRP